VKPNLPPKTPAEPQPAATQFALFPLDDFGIPPILPPAESAPEIAIDLRRPQGAEHEVVTPTFAIQPFRAVPTSTVALTADPSVTRLQIAQIKIDRTLHARDNYSETTIDDYVGLDALGVVLPPITIIWIETENQYVLIDGHHRLEARKQVGDTEIDVIVVKGNRTDAIKLAATSNISHGLPRTHADKRKAIKMLLEDGVLASFSNRRIAEMLQVHHETVGTVRHELEDIGTIPQQKIRTSKNGDQRGVKSVDTPATEIASSAKSQPVDQNDFVVPDVHTSAPDQAPKNRVALEVAPEQKMAVGGGVIEFVCQEVGSDFCLQIDCVAEKVRVQIITDTVIHDSGFVEPNGNLDAQVLQIVAKMLMPLGPL
jgi:ParB-like nuclease domain